MTATVSKPPPGQYRVSRETRPLPERREDDRGFLFVIDVSKYPAREVNVEVHGGTLLISVGKGSSKWIVYEAEIPVPFDMTMTTASIAGGFLEVRIPKASLWKEIVVQQRGEPGEPEAADDLEECDID
jgi:HSP20 family molecular chaperone IbpA